MDAEAIHVGTELLTFRHNTHTAFLSRALAPLGFRMARAALVADNEGEIAQAISAALERSSLVIVTGGLGPTFDDVSREAAARALGRTLNPAPELLAKIKARFDKVKLAMPSSNERQALVLDGASVLDNEAGTAPGQYLDLGERVLLLLPGPSKELESALNVALPLLRGKFSGDGIVVKSFQVVGFTESRVEEMAKPLLAAWPKDGVEPTILASSYIIDLIFQARGLESGALLDKITQEMRKIFGDDLLGENGITLEEQVGRMLAAAGAKLAVAESCTGGMIADRLTDIPGSSAYLTDAVVAYSNEAKTRFLGVSPEILRTQGAVSESAVRQMAEGLLMRSNAQWSVAVTGICGPSGGTPEKPVGMAWFAVGHKGAATESVCRTFSGDRLRLKEKMACYALDLLRRELLKKQTAVAAKQTAKP